MLFTGDALLVRGNGRTDFQHGNPEVLFESIQRLYSFGDDVVVYPGHDYKGFTSSTLGLEKKFNARITATTTKQEFVQTMAQLKLNHPKKIDVAVPANLACGEI